MNPLNHASLEATDRLQAAGIVLETDFYHVTHHADGYFHQQIVTKRYLISIPEPESVYPAPSMAEVWREFNKYSAQEFADLVRRYFDPRNEKGTIFYLVYVARTIDALIDLLIWLKKEAADGEE